MQKIKQWQAKRSGASMTITGNDFETDVTVKLANVVTIGNGYPTGVFAETEDGVTVELHVDA